METAPCGRGQEPFMKYLMEQTSRISEKSSSTGLFSFSNDVVKGLVAPNHVKVQFSKDGFS